LAMAHYALETKGVKGQILPAERFMIRARVRASAPDVERAARLLAEARRPLLVVGDEVWKSGAQSELLAFSERLGLAVASGQQGFANFPVHHPHFLGGFSLGSEFVKRGVDLILAVGTRDFGGRVIPGSAEVPGEARIVRAGVDTSSMSRNYATDL